MIRARFIVFGSIAVLALLLALATVYAYGKWYSHDRYWEGTIKRVQATEVELIRSLLVNTNADISWVADVDRVRRVFEPLDGLLVVEVYQQEDLHYTNAVEHFHRDATLDVVPLSEGWQVQLGSYRSPSWESNFLRWITQPARWLEPSFDHTTMPFLWFLVIYLLALTGLGLMVKSRYLERDVLAVLHHLDERPSL